MTAVWTGRRQHTRGSNSRSSWSRQPVELHHPGDKSAERKELGPQIRADAGLQGQPTQEEEEAPPTQNNITAALESFYTPKQMKTETTGTKLRNVNSGLCFCELESAELP